jgi:hypothetical protein
MNTEHIDNLTKSAAFKIYQILSVFDNLEPNMQDQAEHITMQRVLRLQDGENLIIEGNGLITEFVEPTPEPEPEVISEPEPTIEGEPLVEQSEPPENPEVDTPPA